MCISSQGAQNEADSTLRRGESKTAVSAARLIVGQSTPDFKNFLHCSNGYGTLAGLSVTRRHCPRIDPAK